MNIYESLRLLAKSIRGQNLFSAAKELSSIQLFENKFNLSKIQEIYLSYLYTYEMLNRDIIIDNISKLVTSCEIYEDAYLLWKRQHKKENKVNQNEPEKKSKDMHLVCGNKIIFPTEVK